MRPIAIALTALALAAATPAPAQELRQNARFDLEIRGITVGRLDFAGVENGRSYAVSGTMQSTGLAGMLRKMRYDANVRGTMTARGFAPQRYEQTGGIGKKYTEEIVVWDGGLPRIERQEPPREARATDADPAQQRGTVDTLTALYATLRDVAPGQECQSSVIMYDGRYRMQLQISAPRTEAGGVSCAGEYIRLAGFTPEEMAERTRFPFTLRYEPTTEGRMRVTEVAMDSLYGRARLVRR
ncbi:MAG: DUF3108 domain-containing protein [Gemmobacter sp.]|uniref:DUF3108 domain-containing protein n=1 Tax=Gemmobacter sp. TaxID=1898957 RepID=UPI00391A6437